MKTITWVNFLHIYQPPWQDPAVVRQVVEESYQFLINAFKKYPTLHATINISGTLLETLDALGFRSLITDVHTLIRRGQLELTGSSHYHAFLPQLPEEEIRRQITLHERALVYFFDSYKPAGFFLPEMAYSPAVGDIIKTMGYQWIILDPMSARTEPQDNIKYISRRNGLTVIFRNRKLSSAYPPEEIYKMLSGNTGRAIITATDGELYGHKHKDWQDHLKQILESARIETLTVSDYLRRLADTKPIYLRSASWETRAKQIRTNNPFSIWYNKSNPIHRKLWQLAHLSMELVEKYRSDPNYAWARKHLDRGLSSCSWWWASEIKTSFFTPVAWSPDEVQKGAGELIKSIRSIEKLPGDEKIHAEKIYLGLLEALWIKHWKIYGNRTKI